MPRRVLNITSSAASRKVSTFALVNPTKIAKNKREGVPSEHLWSGKEEWINSERLDDPELISATVGV
jgi:hypothetical protein